MNVAAHVTAYPQPVTGFQVQQMMRVKAEREDLKQDNTKLQSEVRKMQRQLDAKLAEPAANIESDGKLQEQLQMLEDEKAALQEQLQQHVQRAAPPALGAAAPGPLQEGQQGYPQTWKLVDQLRNQNRAALSNTSPSIFSLTMLQHIRLQASFT